MGNNDIYAELPEEKFVEAQSNHELFRKRLHIPGRRLFELFSYRMGIGDGVRHTREETAEKYRVSVLRVIMIENRAFNTCSHHVRIKPLKDFIDSAEDS